MVEDAHDDVHANKQSKHGHTRTYHRRTSHLITYDTTHYITTPGNRGSEPTATHQQVRHRCHGLVVSRHDVDWRAIQLAHHVFSTHHQVHARIVAQVHIRRLCERRSRQQRWCTRPRQSGDAKQPHVTPTALHIRRQRSTHHSPPSTSGDRRSHSPLSSAFFVTTLSGSCRYRPPPTAIASDNMKNRRFDVVSTIWNRRPARHQTTMPRYNNNGISGTATAVRGAGNTQHQTPTAAARNKPCPSRKRSVIPAQEGTSGLCGGGQPSVSAVLVQAAVRVVTGRSDPARLGLL